MSLRRWMSAHLLVGVLLLAVTAAGVLLMTQVVQAQSAPGVTVKPTVLRVFEGGGGTYGVVLDALPSGPVTIVVGGVSGDVSVRPDRLTFTPSNWDAPQTVRVSAGGTGTVRPTRTLS